MMSLELGLVDRQAALSYGEHFIQANVISENMYLNLYQKVFLLRGLYSLLRNLKFSVKFFSGDLSTVSTYCPYGLKLLACQLLLEITAFLRDSCRAYATDKENTTFPKNCINDNRKVSSASIAHARRSVASRSHRAPVIAVSDETGSTAGAKRKTSGYSRHGWLCIFLSISLLDSIGNCSLGSRH